MSSYKVKYLFLSAIIFLLASSSAGASEKPIEIKFLGVSVQERATRAIEFLLGITGALALLLLIVSGVLFIASTGNPESQKKAKGMTIAALTGLILVLLSYSFVYYTEYFAVR